MPVVSRKLKGQWVFPALLFTGLLVVNGLLVSPYIGWYDSGEMVGVTQCLGISHPSGQVLFHLLGKIFLLLPHGTPALRLGLMSVCCSALASVLFWALACKLSFLATAALPADTRPTPTLRIWFLLLTLAWSFSLPWWRYSLMPLVYALHLLLGLLALWAISLNRPFKWPLAFFILGAATVFRPTQFFAVPFAALAFVHEFYSQPLFPPWPVALAGNYRASRNRFASQIKKKGIVKSVLFVLTAFVLGRSTALYLPLRSALRPQIAYGDPTHWGAALHHVLALKFSKSVGTSSAANMGSVLHQMFSHFSSDLTAIGVGLLLWGILLLAWRKDKVPAFLWVGVGWGMLEVLFVFTIPFPTFESHQMLLGWVFCGFLAVLPLAWTEHILKSGQFRFLKGAMYLLLSGFVLLQGTQAGHLLERKGDRGAQDYGRDVLTVMEPNALYIPTEDNEFFPVVGYQQSFGYRKDVHVLEPGMSNEAVGKKIQEAIVKGNPLYVTRKWDLPEGWSYEPVGPLLKVVRPNPPPDKRMLGRIIPFREPAAQWGDVVLQGAYLAPATVRQGGILEIGYDWYDSGLKDRRVGTIRGTSAIVALFTDEKGNYWMKNGLFWLHDVHEPFDGSFQDIRQDELCEEKRVVFIPSDYPPGHYRLVVGLQKQMSAGQPGSESFKQEFYERGAAQEMEKFSGRGDEGGVVQFSASTTSNLPDELWPVTKSRVPLMDPHFVPVAEVEILPAEGN